MYMYIYICICIYIYVYVYIYIYKQGNKNFIIYMVFFLILLNRFGNKCMCVCPGLILLTISLLLVEQSWNPCIFWVFIHSTA